MPTLPVPTAPPVHLHTPAARRPLRAHAAMLSVLLAITVPATMPAFAAPDPAAPAAPAAIALVPAASASAPTAASGDAVLHLLQEKGLLPATTAAAQIAARVEASPLVRQVRDTASDLVISAMNFLGVRYRRGGNSIDQGFDCSGFTRYVFEHSLGLALPRRADEQARQAGLASITQADLKPGDLVFFNTMRRAFSHVGIYVGEGKFIHAPSAGGQVRIEDMRQSYWTKRFNGARRAALAGVVPVSVLDVQARRGSS